MKVVAEEVAPAAAVEVVVVDGVLGGRAGVGESESGNC